MAQIDEVVVGATKKDLEVTVVGNDGNAINLTGGSVRVQGKSSDLAGVSIDVVGALTDPALGKVKFTQIGTFVTAGQLGAVPRATFRLRVKYTDVATLFDYSDIFEISWLPTPI